MYLPGYKIGVAQAKIVNVVAVWKLRNPDFFIPIASEQEIFARW